LTRLAAKHGADAALVLNPFYYKGLMTDDVLVGHYHAVADGSPIPVIIYNMPANSGIDMGEKVLVRIAEHKNIIGLKDSGGDIKKMTQVVKHTADDFGLLAGSAGFLLPALEIGATGVSWDWQMSFPRNVLTFGIPSQMVSWTLPGLSSSRL
ncbi:dihydrodipicolinate synthase family protein, partial [Bacteroidota bacterium]